MNTLVNWFFTALQYTIVILMAPVTIAVCAGLLGATYLISRTLYRPKQTALTTNESYEWLRGPTSEWLGA